MEYIFSVYLLHLICTFQSSQRSRKFLQILPYTLFSASYSFCVPNFRHYTTTFVFFLAKLHRPDKKRYHAVNQWKEPLSTGDHQDDNFSRGKPLRHWLDLAVPLHFVLNCLVVPALRRLFWSHLGGDFSPGKQRQQQYSSSPEHFVGTPRPNMQPACD